MAALAVGHGHACALMDEVHGGGVKCWGANGHGQLGDGATTQRSTPVDVSGLASGVSALAAGYDHTCALTTGGGVKCWGSNYWGQLGDGTTTQRSAPVDVIGLASDVTGLAAGGEHTCALTTEDGVKCWGPNEYGQLGNGTTTDHSTPIDVSSLTSGVTALATGRYHTCALTITDGVKCWGANWDGQLGDGTTYYRLAPVDVSGLTSGVTAVDAGAYHTCALTTGAGVRCWGQNWYGQLGDGTTAHRSAPVDVIGLASEVTAVAAGGDQTCVLTTHDGVKCWGWNGYGQLGDGTTTARSTPVDAVGLAQGVISLTTGESHTCVLTNQRPKCWGADGDGPLGLGTPLQRLTPVDVVASAAPQIRLNYAAGQPGSYFTLTGDNFPPGAQATVSVNGATVTTSLPINQMGQFIAFLSTSNASPGYYVVRVSAGVTAMNAFVLDAP